ncbi:hypothetical protein EA462_08265 [Natrarchaeobius halalkaliphilus]|uniref:Uncharacterized protein n=1 Tax=Natrarchaeobius halalkaliphilus TaxID=1679091 RepID=A0A3N6M439_9EURY|nr:hypothetical protein [Natrarchaeobius halalkaliphilus]RQG89991.1 hypothetical protein EA462_08265 [Natrarchaeobius halalkaliphilus]
MDAIRSPPIETLAIACKRYGPGRMPGAGRRDIGAGYAGSAAALAIAIGFALSMAVLPTLGLSSDFAHPFWGLAALVSLPIVVPVAFVASVFVWRALPSDVPYFGVVAGFLATVVTYLASLAIVFLIRLLWFWWTGAESVLVDVGGFVALIGLFATVLTVWLTIPVGCVSGAIYEYARRISSA